MHQLRSLQSNRCGVMLCAAWRTIHLLKQALFRSSINHMTKRLRQILMIGLGWLCVFLGVLGLLLPLFPGMLFMAMALYLFAGSSQRFHRMLLDNRWIGMDLRRWQERRTISMSAFRKASTIVVLSFLISIALLNGRIGLQILLACFGVVVLWYLWRISEQAENTVTLDK